MHWMADDRIWQIGEIITDFVLSKLQYVLCAFAFVKFKCEVTGLSSLLSCYNLAAISLSLSILVYVGKI
jgi:hypothetical protein